MAGHSKWANIKHRKGAQDAKRAKVFSRIARALITAVQNGGDDPEMNSALKLAMDQARKANMPKENVARAVARGRGVSADGSQLQSVLYEAITDDGISLLIACSTDNTNRTLSEIRTILRSFNAKAVPENSVRFKFDYVGAMKIPLSIFSDDVELELIECGATDINERGDVAYVIFPQDKFSSFVNTFSEIAQEASLSYLPQQEVSVGDAVRVTVEELLEELENHDDVIATYSDIKNAS